MSKSYTAFDWTWIISRCHTPFFHKQAEEHNQEILGKLKSLLTKIIADQNNQIARSSEDGNASGFQAEDFLTIECTVMLRTNV